MQTAPFSTAAGTSSALAAVPTEKRAEVEPGERLRRGELHLELAVSERDPRSRGPLGGERADVLVAALGEELELDRAHGAGRADYSDA